MLEGKRNLVFIVISFCLVFLAANMVFAEEKYVYPRKTKYEGEKINVAMVSEAICEELVPLLPRFEEQTGIKVNLELYPYQNLQEKMMIALTQQSGAYDVVHIDCVRYGQFAGQGWVIPLDDYIAKTDPDVLRFEDHMPGLMEQQAYWDGKVYGLPYISAAMGLVYRNDITEQYGIKLPETWDELIEVCKKLQIELPEGMYPLIFTAKRDEAVVCTYFNLLGSYGGYVYDSEYRAALDTEAARKSLIMLKEMLNYCPPGTTTYDHAEVLQAFGDGKIVFGIYWFNQAPVFENPNTSRIVGKWDAYLMPGVRQEDGSIKRAHTTGGWGLGISKDSKHKDAAWEFLVWASSEEVQRAVIKGGHPSRKSILEDPEVQKEHRELKWFLEALNSTIGRPRIPEWPEISQSMQVWISNYLTGASSLDETVQNMNKEINDILKRSGRQK